MRYKEFCITVTALIALVACAENKATSTYKPDIWVPTIPNYDLNQIKQQLAALTKVLQQIFPDYPKVGTTYLSFDPDHKFQITYYETPERSWLWYGGNEVSLPAQWKLEKRDFGKNGGPEQIEATPRICFKYGANTYNPLADIKGGDFKCTILSNSLMGLVSSLEGDIFNLSSGTVPYVRQECDAPDEFELRLEENMWGTIPVEDCL